LVRILVTGVTGFHGYHVSQALKEKGYDVFGLVRHSAQGKRLPPDVVIVEGDITDTQAMIEVMKTVRPNVVVHLAALTPVAKSFEQPHIYADTNYRGTINVVEAWRKVVPKEERLGFIYASTSECYGQQDRFPITEDAPLRPNTPYAVSKLAGELYVRCYLCEELGEPVVVSVPFNSYGRAYVGQRWFVIEKILSNIAEGKTEIELGDPTAIRDFLFREDVVSAYLALVDAILYKPWAVMCKRYNFCTGRGVSIAELVKIIERVAGVELRVRWHRHQRPADIKVLIGSYYRALRDLGWAPQWSLEDGIRRALEEWREVLRG